MIDFPSSKLRTGKSRQIFIHFCFSLLMLYIVFLAGIDNGRVSVTIMKCEITVALKGRYTFGNDSKQILI